MVWQVEHSAGVALLWGLFGFGWLLVLVSTFLINHFELFGLRQVFARLTQRALPEAQFKTPLLYRYVRHPLYVGLLLTFWSVPVMTAGRLLFALGCSAYILIGICARGTRPAPTVRRSLSHVSRAGRHADSAREIAEADGKQWRELDNLMLYATRPLLSASIDSRDRWRETNVDRQGLARNRSTTVSMRQTGSDQT